MNGKCPYCRREYVHPKSCSRCAGKKIGVKKLDVERGLGDVFDRIRASGRCSAFFAARVVMKHTGFPRKTAEEVVDAWIDRGFLKEEPNESFESKGELITWTPLVLGTAGDDAAGRIDDMREVITSE